MNSMIGKEKIQLEFGIPKNGWLQTTFNYGNYRLEFEISNIPLDPMVQLCDALI